MGSQSSSAVGDLEPPDWVMRLATGVDEDLTDDARAQARYPAGQYDEKATRDLKFTGGIVGGVMTGMLALTAAIDGALISIVPLLVSYVFCLVAGLVGRRADRSIRRWLVQRGRPVFGSREPGRWTDDGDPVPLTASAAYPAGRALLASRTIAASLTGTGRSESDRRRDDLLGLVRDVVLLEDARELLIESGKGRPDMLRRLWALAQRRAAELDRKTDEHLHDLQRALADRAAPVTDRTPSGLALAEAVEEITALRFGFGTLAPTRNDSVPEPARAMTTPPEETTSADDLPVAPARVVEYWPWDHAIQRQVWDAGHLRDGATGFGCWGVLMLTVSVLVAFLNFVAGRGENSAGWIVAWLVTVLLTLSLGIGWLCWHARLLALGPAATVERPTLAQIPSTSSVSSDVDRLVVVKSRIERLLPTIATVRPGIEQLTGPAVARIERAAGDVAVLEKVAAELETTGRDPASNIGLNSAIQRRTLLVRHGIDSLVAFLHPASQLAETIRFTGASAAVTRDRVGQAVQELQALEVGLRELGDLADLRPRGTDPADPDRDHGSA